MSELNKYKKMIRPFDVVITVILMVMSFIPIGVFILQQSNVHPDSEIIAVISINGNEVDRFILAKDTPHKEIKYTAQHGLTGDQYNIIEVEGTRIRVKQDNSPDQVAVQQGWISRPGQTRICLPHRLIIRIEATNSHLLEDEEIIISG